MTARDFIRRFRLAGVAAVALLASAALPAHADDYKIGVIHTERILQQSRPAKVAYERIVEQFKPRDADITKKEQDVRVAAGQLEKDRASLTADQVASRERALEAQTHEAQRLRQQFVEDLKSKQFEELDKLKERLDQVLTRYAKERNYDLILQDALFVGRSVDITDEIIKALDTQ